MGLLGLQRYLPKILPGHRQATAHAVRHFEEIHKGAVTTPGITPGWSVRRAKAERFRWSCGLTHATHPKGVKKGQVKSRVTSRCTWSTWNPPQGEAKRDNPEGQNGLHSALSMVRQFHRLMPRGLSDRGHFHLPVPPLGGGDGMGPSGWA